MGTDGAAFCWIARPKEMRTSRVGGLGVGLVDTSFLTAQMLAFSPRLCVVGLYMMVVMPDSFSLLWSWFFLSLTFDAMYILSGLTSQPTSTYGIGHRLYIFSTKRVSAE